MESTTIRLSKKDKKAIKELIAYFTMKAETKISQLELISLLVSLGKDQKEKILQEIF